MHDVAKRGNKEKHSGKKGTPNTEQVDNDKVMIIVHERKKNTHTLLMFVRFLLFGESMVERFMLRASLPNN
jgi:hypothetical protein